MVCHIGRAAHTLGMPCINHRVQAILSSRQLHYMHGDSILLPKDIALFQVYAHRQIFLQITRLYRHPRPIAALNQIGIFI
ncbi:hypothetical protein UF16_09855 [Chromobacterium violaceum]|nr:hypothetical protein UF16_09855 [Chromobacterium violaceum]